jgi:hypothetical protein
MTDLLESENIRLVQIFQAECLFDNLLLLYI